MICLIFSIFLVIASNNLYRWIISYLTNIYKQIKKEIKIKMYLFWYEKLNIIISSIDHHIMASILNYFLRRIGYCLDNQLKKKIIEFLE